MYYVLRKSRSNTHSIIVRNTESGQEKEIYRINGSLHIRLSPDGEWLAIQQYYTENKLVPGKIPALAIMPSAGGEPKVLCKYENGIDIRAGAPFSWTPDGKYILYSMKSPDKEDDKWDLYRISIKGGNPEKLGLEMGGFMSNLSIHPDGKKIAFSITEPANAEVWMMENFRPKEEAKKK
jgi:dipeptidyl aminopeptidase/acylaminoacyl peptidase